MFYLVTFLSPQHEQHECRPWAHSQAHSYLYRWTDILNALRSLVLTPYKVIADCPLQTDLVLVSSDGHRFGTHMKNLGEFTGSFPLHITPTHGEEVQPDLDSKALPLFLQYVHHHRQPDLSLVPFITLKALAEAVEKYEVYSLTEICKVKML